LPLMARAVLNLDNPVAHWHGREVSFNPVVAWDVTDVLSQAPQIRH